MLSLGKISLQDRGHEVQREVAVDHRRDARQDLEQRLEHARTRGSRVLAQVDRAPARAAAPRPSPGASQERGAQQRQDSECFSANSGVHCVSVRNSHDRDLAEERHRLDEQHGHDADGGEDSTTPQARSTAGSTSSLKLLTRRDRASAHDGLPAPQPGRARKRCGHSRAGPRSGRARAPPVRCAQWAEDSARPLPAPGHSDPSGVRSVRGPRACCGSSASLGDVATRAWLF